MEKCLITVDYQVDFVNGSLGFDGAEKLENAIAEKIEKYLGNGAQPTPRVAKLLADNKIKLPDWVKLVDKKTRTIKNAEKLRRNQPKEEAPAEEAPVAEEAEAAEKAAE